MAEIIIGREKIFGDTLTISDDGTIVVNGTPSGNIKDISQGVANVHVSGELKSLSLNTCDALFVHGAIQNLKLGTGKTINVQGRVQNITLKKGQVRCLDVGCDVSAENEDVICIKKSFFICYDVHGSIFAEYGMVNFKYLGEDCTSLFHKEFIADNSDDTEDVPVKLPMAGINVFVSGFVENLSLGSWKNASIFGTVDKLDGDAADINIEGEVGGYIKGNDIAVVCSDVYGNIRITNGDITCNDVDYTIKGPDGLLKFYCRGYHETDFKKDWIILQKEGLRKIPFYFFI